MSKAQEVHDQVEALVAGGMTKANAFKQLSTELGQPVGSLRGAYYAHTRKENGGSGPRKRETTPADAIAQAVAVLEKAIAAIDTEVEAAKDRAEEAKREHEALRSSATERKESLKQKIATLSS